MDADDDVLVGQQRLSHASQVRQGVAGCDRSIVTGDFGTAIPNHYYEALSERMLTNGFFARMMILECGQQSTGQEPKIRELPPRVF